ncbi:MAG: ATP-binding cassette domain-containing protein, partial [Devosia sp.]
MTAAQDLIMDENTLISVRGVRKYFPVYEGWFRREVGAVKAVDDITFDIRKGETFGLVGESGSGKSSIARLILRAYELTGGEILFRRGNGSVVDISRLSDREMRDIRREMQMI